MRDRRRPGERPGMRVHVAGDRDTLLLRRIGARSERRASRDGVNVPVTEYALQFVDAAVDELDAGACD